jgi:hypothetical protein
MSFGLGPLMVLLSNPLKALVFAETVPIIPIFDPVAVLAGYKGIPPPILSLG